MDVDELRATLRQMQRVRADETLPAYLRECAEPFVESLASIFERADGVAQEPVSIMDRPVFLGGPTPKEAEREMSAIHTQRMEHLTQPASVTVEQDGSKFVVRGDETLAKMLQALLSAAAGKQVGDLSGRLFALAIEAAGAGL